MYTDYRNLMPNEQKGCCGGLIGCKVQLRISKAILQECKSKKKNVCMEWIDYKKVFDSVPHSWIIKSLQLIGINNKIISFNRKATNYCKTSTCLHTEGKIIQCVPLATEPGISLIILTPMKI
jgi:hypothetical protein